MPRPNLPNPTPGPSPRRGGEPPSTSTDQQPDGFGPHASTTAQTSLPASEAVLPLPFRAPWWGPQGGPTLPGGWGVRSPQILLAPPGYSRDDAMLSPTRIADLCTHLRTGRTTGLARMPVREIVEAIDRAVASWDTAGGRRDHDIEQLSAVTGYHLATVRLAFDDVSRAFRAPALERLLRRELGSPDALDCFLPRAEGGGSQRAFGPGLTTVVLSGNVFHVAVESMVLALLAKSACLVKASSRDPLFPALVAGSLAAADERLAAALAVAWWSGGDAGLERAAFAGADAVIAYGGTEAVAAVRGHTPVDVRFVAHGPKISFAVVARSHAAGPHGEATASAAAHDVAMYDQQGCVSPHTIYVEGSPGDALAFGRLLAGAMARTELEAPRGRLTTDESARIRQVRGAAEFRQGVEVFESDGGTAWTVIVDADPLFAASCLNRVVYVKPLDRPERLPELIEPVRPFLQTAGVAGDPTFRAAVAEIVAPLGVARVCPLGRMQHPPADWRHDGRPRLLDLLRWTDLE
jgi:hypothetical protein